MSDARLGGMATIGTSPLDPTSDVGRVRLTVGDEDATNVDETTSEGSYAYFSDDAIGAALYNAGGSILRACSLLVKRLAIELTAAGQDISADGFKIKTTGKGGDLFDIAKEFAADADLQDAKSAREEEGGLAIVSSVLRHPMNPDVRFC